MFEAKLSVEEAFVNALKPIIMRMNRFPGLLTPPRLYVEADISSGGVKIAIQERG